MAFIDNPAPEAPVRVGDLIESADDPRIAALPTGSVLADRDGDEVDKRTEGYWNGGGFVPLPIQGNKFGPWTVRRIGKENG